MGDDFPISTSSHSHHAYLMPWILPRKQRMSIAMAALLSFSPLESIKRRSNGIENTCFKNDVQIRQCLGIAPGLLDVKLGKDPQDETMVLG